MGDNVLCVPARTRNARMQIVDDVGAVHTLNRLGHTGIELKFKWPLYNSGIDLVSARGAELAIFAPKGLLVRDLTCGHATHVEPPVQNRYYFSTLCMRHRAYEILRLPSSHMRTFLMLMGSGVVKRTTPWSLTGAASCWSPWKTMNRVFGLWQK